MMPPHLFVLERLRRLRAAPAPPAAPAAARATAEPRPSAARARKSGLVSALYLLSGVAAAAFGLKAFLLPNAFFDGGVTGLSLLATRLTGLPLSVFLVVFNLPFVWLGYRQLGAGFAARALGAIVALAGVLVLVEFPVLTQDKLLIAVFGGFFLGAGIGLAMRGGAVLDGTEILALHLSRNSPLSVGDLVLGLNVLIFLGVAWVVSVETALYSILAYLAAAKTIEFVVSGIEEYTGITVVSEHGDAIRRLLTRRLGRGVTVYAGKRGYGSRGELPTTDLDIVFTIVTRLEVQQVLDAVRAFDAHAFVFMHPVGDVRGGMVKRRALH